ncbi:MAG: hypothetical protein ACXAC2_14280 [Candidatus Kariarchaeaceae archaeon]|jgi:hypothetical protein
MLVQDLYSLQNIGKLVRLEINLVNHEDSQVLLQEEFNEFSEIGLYSDGRIHLYCSESNLPDFHRIFYNIGEIFGTFNVIESVSVVLRIMLNEKSLKFVVEVMGEHKMQKLLSVNEMMYYFYILNYLSFKWLTITNELKLKS